MRTTWTGHSSGVPSASPMTKTPAGMRTSRIATPSPRSTVIVVSPRAAWRCRASVASNGQSSHETVRTGGRGGVGMTGSTCFCGIGG